LDLNKKCDWQNEYFFDRDGKAFRYILQYYRNDKIYWPNLNQEISKEELLIKSKMKPVSTHK
jgi:hypothetical protein